MESNLLELLDNYSKILTQHTSVQYIPMLRDYFIPYLIKNYQCKTLYDLFSNEITRNGIINSAVYYVENNENLKSKSRLNYFLNALDSLFKEVLFDKYPNPNIRKIYPFTNLADEICIILSEKGIILKQTEQNPAITDEQFHYIIQYLNEHTPKSRNEWQEYVILKLYLLYGFSPDKLSTLKLEDYSFDKNTLQIPCSTRKDIVIHLELPYTLSIEINKYISIRADKINSPLLFVKSTGNAVSSNYLKEYLDKIKKAFYKTRVKTTSKNTFTPTGIQKYALIKMIESGMNQSIIMDFTGQSQDIFNDCQSVVDERKHLNRNRYINHIIRGIDTYDLL